MTRSDGRYTWRGVLAVLGAAGLLATPAPGIASGPLRLFNYVSCTVGFGQMTLTQRGAAVDGSYSGGSFHGTARNLGVTGTLYDRKDGQAGVWAYLDWDLRTLHGAAKFDDGRRSAFGGTCVPFAQQTANLGLGLAVPRRFVKHGVRVSDHFPVVVVVRNYGPDALRHRAADYVVGFPPGIVYWTGQLNQFVDDGTLDIGDGRLYGHLRVLPRRQDRARIALVVSPPEYLVGQTMTIAAGVFNDDDYTDTGGWKTKQITLRVLP